MGKVYHIHQIKLIEAFQTFEKKQTVDKALASYLDKNCLLYTSDAADES